MTGLIGAAADERHACSDDVHLPNCYNPRLDLTACVCGAQWWSGQVGVWRSCLIRREVGRTPTSGRPIYEAAGWDRYFLHTEDCPDRESATAEPVHRCADVAPMSAAEAFGRRLGDDAARAVGRFDPDGPVGYRAKSSPDGPLRETRAEALADEAALFDLAEVPS